MTRPQNMSKVEKATIDDADWSFVENQPETVEAVASASRKAAAWRATSSEEDLHQEGLIYLSVRPELAASHPGKVYGWVLRHLIEQDQKEAKHEALTGADVEEWEEDMGLYNNGMQDDRFANMLYPEELVRVLLEAHWNGWTVVDEFRPDPDMPRAKPNPSRLGTDMAHRVDIKRALESATLTKRERLALQLTIGEGMTHEAAAFGLDVDRSTVTRDIDQALKVLCLLLNGCEGEA